MSNPVELMAKIWAQPSDFVIECVDGNINAHQLIVGVSCEWFIIALEIPMKEAKSRIVKLDWPVKIVQIIVDWVYTTVIKRVTVCDCDDKKSALCQFASRWMTYLVWWI